MLNMLEAEKASYAYSPGTLPDNIASYSATGTQQVTLHLRHRYSSIWYTYNQLAILYPLPLAWDVTRAGSAPGSGGCETDSAADGWAACKAVWRYLNSQNMRVSRYATNPLWQVVDGPFRLTSFSLDGDYTFVPNPEYSGSPKPAIAELKFVAYNSASAIYTALKNGRLSEGPVPSADLPPAAKNFLPPTNPLAGAPGGGYYLQAALSFTIGYASINYDNPTYGAVFTQTYFRQALKLLDNEAGMSDAVGHGYSTPTVAAVPSEPPSQWISSAMKKNHGQGPLPYDPARARALLSAHGWKVERRVLTCEHAGTGPSDCGAKIPTGRQARFSVLYTSGLSAQADDVDILKSGLAQVGIQLQAKARTFDQLLADTVPCTPEESRCHWTFLYLGGWDYNGPGFEPTGEPLFQTGAPNNSGSYSSPRMDKLINATHTSNSLSAFRAYADYTAEQVPSLWLPWPTSVVAVSNHLRHVSQSPLSEFYPEYWRCGTTSC